MAKTNSNNIESEDRNMTANVRNEETKRFSDSILRIKKKIGKWN
ncbi:MAG: hypothetical protein WAM14_01025 [Candidatus Nitrosopolaris sp.]